MFMDDSEDLGILNIPESTKYWLVRADGGKYLNDYIENDFISLAHNKVTIKQILDKDSPKDALGDTDIHQLYWDNYNKSTKQWVTTAAKQCYEFVRTMQIGDVVLCPGKDSNEFAIGIISSDAYDANYEKLKTKKNNAPSYGIQYAVDTNMKRRKISWIKTISRNSLPGELFWVLSAHQAIFNISTYGEYVDPLIFPLYQKAGKLHLLVHSTGNSDLTLNDWQALLNLTASEGDSYSDVVHMQAEVHCPGLIHFITDPQNIKAFKNVVSYFLNPAVTTGTIPFVLWISLGKEGRKQGFFKWLYSIKATRDNYKVTHLQSKIEVKKLKKELNDNDPLKNVKPKIINDGTLIPDTSHSTKRSNDDQTESNEQKSEKEEK